MSSRVVTNFALWILSRLITARYSEIPRRVPGDIGGLDGVAASMMGTPGAALGLPFSISGDGCVSRGGSARDGLRD
jgi:hypothetical protein